MTKETKDLGAAPPRSLTDSELEDLERALRAASPPPWRAEKMDHYTTYHCSVRDANGFTIVMDEAGDGSDTEAIAALRNAAPSLISDSRALLEARRLLWHAIEIQADTDHPAGCECPWCEWEILAHVFLRSDSERSEPARSESGGSNPVDAPTREER